MYYLINEITTTSQVQSKCDPGILEEKGPFCETVF